jgi:hypothetical protein
MPLDTNDWVQDIDGVSSTQTILHNTGTVINGDRSVRFTITNGGIAGTKGAAAIYLDLTNHTRGFALGRIRTLIRVDQQVDHAGIYAVGSQVAGIAGAGSAYVFGPAGATHELTLSKLDNGLFDTTPSIISSTGVTMGAAITAVKAIELEWKADLTIFGGTQLICRAGDAIDFSDLAIVFQGTDETAPLLTAASEGLFAFRAGITTTGQVTFDDTTVFETTIIP